MDSFHYYNLIEAELRYHEHNYNTLKTVFLPKLLNALKDVLLEDLDEKRVYSSQQLLDSFN